MAFSVNLFSLLFYHLPRIYSPFTIYTRSQIQTHKYTTNFHSSTFNAQSFFPCVCILFAFCSCLFACNFFLSALAFVFFKVVLESGDCVCLFITVPFFSRSLHFLHYVRISTSIFSLLCNECFSLHSFWLAPQWNDDENANALTQSFQSNSLNRFRTKIYSKQRIECCTRIVLQMKFCRQSIEMVNLRA